MSVRGGTPSWPPSAVGPQGGRYIWQIAGGSDFIACWMETPDENPAVVESGLIAEFRAHYGARPLGNRKD